MHGVEKPGVRKVATIVAVLLLIVAVSAVAVGELNSTVAQEHNHDSAFDSPLVERTIASDGELSESASLAGDRQVDTVDLDEIAGVNVTQPDRTYTAEVEPELDYSIEFVSGAVVTPDEGIATTVLQVDYVFDEFASDVELADLDLADLKQVVDGESDSPLVADTRLDSNLTLEPDFAINETLVSGDGLPNETDDDDRKRVLAETIDIDVDVIGNLSFADDDISLSLVEERLGVQAQPVPVMVQFEGGFDREYIDELERLEYQLTDDLADHTHYALLPAENVADLAALPFVRSVSDVEPATKISPALEPDSASPQPVIVSTFGDLDPGEMDLEPVDADVGERPAPTDEELALMGIDRDVYEFQTSDVGELYVGELTGEEISRLSESSLVRWLDAWALPTTDLDESKTTGGVEHTDLLPAADGWDGTDTTVGVLDSGIEADHPHFDDADVILSYDWTADLLPYTAGDSGQDNDGHGTHVAGTIVGEGGGYSGVAPESTLVVSRVLDDPDSVPEEAANPQTWFTDDTMWVGPLVKPTRVFDEVAVSGAIAGNHVDVMSNSWGYDWGSYDYLITGPTDGWAHSNPYTLQITSNGNAEDTSTWPAAGKNVLAVGGLDDDHTLSRYNDISPPEDGQVKPDVNAPACHTTADIGHEYNSKCGTSMATPYVSALAARYIGYEKAERNVDRIRANEVKTALIASTTGQLNPRGYEGVGWGAINDLKLYHLATTPGNQFTSVVTDNDVNVHSFEVPEDAGHVEVTLSWSEKQNRLTTSFLRNDLHLYLTDEDPDDVIEIESNWFGSDDVHIDVDEPLQVDNTEDRTVRRVSIPTENLDPGEWHILVHAEDTTWDSNSVLYDVAIDLQGDDGLSVDAPVFEIPAGGQTDVRLELHGGHPGDASAGMIPEIAPGVQLENLDVVGGAVCGWELLRGDEVLDSGGATDVTAAVGTVTGANAKYLDVCVETDRQRGSILGIEYEFTYIDYPDDRVTTPSQYRETGSREVVSGLVPGAVMEAEDDGAGDGDDSDGGSGGDGPGFALPVVAVGLGAAVMLSRLRD